MIKVGQLGYTTGDDFNPRRKGGEFINKPEVKEIQ